MKKLRLLAVVLLCSMAIGAQAQISGSKDFIHLPYKYDLRLSDYYLRIPLEENWGFQVPFLNEKNAELTIASNVSYYFSSSKVNKPVSFFFAMPGKNTACMELRITGYAAPETDKTIKSEAGNWNLVEEIEEVKVESYQQIISGYTFTFRILTKDEKEKEICRNIIASCSDNYYSDSDYGYDYGDYLTTHSIQYYAKDSTYYPSFGLGFVIDFDAYADIYAKKCNINEATTMLEAELSFDDEDYDGTTFYSYFKAPQFLMKYTFVKDQEDADYLIDRVKGEYKDYSSFNYQVGGVMAKVHIVGPKSIPTIYVEIPTNNYVAVFYFLNVTKESQPKVEKFLSQIYIDADQKTGIESAVKNQLPFSQLSGITVLADVQPTKQVKLDKKIKNKKEDKITIHYAKSKVSLVLPKLSESYYSTADSYYNDEITSKTKEITMPETAVGENVEEYFVSYNYDEDISYYVYSIDHSDPTNSMSYIYTMLSSTNEDYVLDYSYAMVNNREWRILTLKTESGPMAKYYTTTVGNRNIWIMIQSHSQDNDINMLDPYLYKASFKK